jgi:hypothetical protein
MVLMWVKTFTFHFIWYENNSKDEMINISQIKLLIYTGIKLDIVYDKAWF